MIERGGSPLVSPRRTTSGIAASEVTLVSYGISASPIALGPIGRSKSKEDEQPTPLRVFTFPEPWGCELREYARRCGVRVTQESSGEMRLHVREPGALSGFRRGARKSSPCPPVSDGR